MKRRSDSDIIISTLTQRRHARVNLGVYPKFIVAEFRKINCREYLRLRKWNVSCARDCAVRVTAARIKSYCFQLETDYCKKLKICIRNFEKVRLIYEQGLKGVQ